MSRGLGRRGFLAALPASVIGGIAILRGKGTLHAQPLWEHPEPRPGIDGSRVLTADQLTAPHVASLFDGVRAIPHIVDGIRCHCGCAELEGYRSLLSCFEAPGMAQWCEICQSEGRLAVRRAAEGQTLDQIRRAIDARYASGMPHGSAHHSRSDHHSRHTP